MLSLVCDYRVMADGSSRNAWLCMNEVCERALPVLKTGIYHSSVSPGSFWSSLAFVLYRHPDCQNW